jgi:hypothetical protein
MSVIAYTAVANRVEPDGALLIRNIPAGMAARKAS